MPKPKERTVFEAPLSARSSINRLQAGLRSSLTSWLQRLWYDSSPALDQRKLFRAFSFSSRLYGHMQERSSQRDKLHQNRLPAYVISIGNLVAGGTGKTPFTIWLAAYLQSLGTRVAVLSRGYGGKNRVASRVPENGDISHLARQFGDEPVLMARRLNGTSVWVGRKRWLSGLKALHSDEAELLILDDGFQHFSLKRDLDLVLLDSQSPFGNGSLLPLGPLREPINQLERADALILTRADDCEKSNETRLAVQSMFPDKPVFCCRHRLSGFRFGLSGANVPLQFIQNLRAVTFTGIARPDSFFASIAASGITVAEHFAFPDHYFYAPHDLLRLLQSLNRSGADLLITTEKDIVRLPAEFHSTVLTAQLELDLGADRQRLCDFLDEQIGR